MTIKNLATHPSAYVSVAELAEYWSISRKQIHKHIETGALPAIRLGPKLYRIARTAAVQFERSALTARITAKGA